MPRTVQQLFDLSGKTALVTGGSDGVGLQMAYALGEAGARIMLTARHADALEHAVADLQSAGIDARWMAVDGEQDADICHLVDETLHRMGDVDILLNNAGVTERVPCIDPLQDGWDKAMSGNVRSYFLLSQRVAQKSMFARRQGCIINIAPLAAQGGNPVTLGAIAYSTASDSILHCTRGLAAEWGQYNITVNALCPVLSSGRMAQSTSGDEDGLKGACVLLASEAGKHITGQCLVVGHNASITGA